MTRATAAAALIAVAAAVLAGCGTSGVRAPSAGPLGSDEHSSVGFAQPAGKAFPFGLAIAFERSGQPARLQRIAPFEPSSGLRLVDTRVAGSARPVTLVGSHRWPDASFKDLHAVAGYTVAPVATGAGHVGVQLILVLRADRPGRYVVRGVAVDYTVAGTRHHAVIHQGMAVCLVPSGRTLPVGGCPEPLL